MNAGLLNMTSACRCKPDAVPFQNIISKKAPIFRGFFFYHENAHTFSCFGVGIFRSWLFDFKNVALELDSNAQKKTGPQGHNRQVSSI